MEHNIAHNRYCPWFKCLQTPHLEGFEDLVISGFCLRFPARDGSKRTYTCNSREIAVYMLGHRHNVTGATADDITKTIS